MKKTLISTAAAALCACTLTASAFAEDVLTDRSVYAQNRNEIAQSVKSMKVHTGEVVSVDENSVMPLYRTDILDYAKTGVLEIKPFSVSAGQRYVSNAVNEKGDVVGIAEFTVGAEGAEIGSYQEIVGKADSVAFEMNSKRVQSLMKNDKFNTDCKEIKLLFVDGVGYVYYIDNGSNKLLVASNIDEVNGNFFNDKNGGIIEVGSDEFEAAAKAELTKYEEWQKILASLAPGENPPTDGFEMPTYKVDNTPYLNGGADTDIAPNPVPNTGSTAQAFAGVIALGALTAAAVTVVKRRKKD